jgi:hypothetical protein
MKKSGTMQGRKTHTQMQRNLESKPDIGGPAKSAAKAHVAKKRVRQSEFPVSRQGMNEESSHNKHNRPHAGG